MSTHWRRNAAAVSSSSPKRHFPTERFQIRSLLSLSQDVAANKLPFIHASGVVVKDNQVERCAVRDITYVFALFWPSQYRVCSSRPTVSQVSIKSWYLLFTSALSFPMALRSLFLDSSHSTSVPSSTVSNAPEDKLLACHRRLCSIVYSIKSSPC